LPAKGLTARRGYGWAHQQLRERVKRAVHASGVRCARCKLLIAPNQQWDLDHDDYDRSRYLGASHRLCNQRAKTGRIHPPAPALSFFNS